MSIYVEICIRGPLDELWGKTQDPELHQRWDIRFTSIQYLPQTNDAEPQRFLYSTRIGFGLCIRGQGETLGSRDDSQGRRTSSLRFWSDDRKSLIKEGAGYWQYVPVENSVRFITGFDYQTRFGCIGRAIDRVAFRPLMGWGTAWSFDRLRLWIEKGIDPAVSMQHTVVHALSRITVATVWFYQGLVPKLLVKDVDELAMLTDAGISASGAAIVSQTIGWAEILLAVLVLVLFRRRWPLVLTIALMLAATVGVAIHSPQYLPKAFNPVSLNLLMATVASIGVIMMKDLPSAGRCMRKKPASLTPHVARLETANRELPPCG